MRFTARLGCSIPPIVLAALFPSLSGTLDFTGIVAVILPFIVTPLLHRHSLLKCLLTWTYAQVRRAVWSECRGGGGKGRQWQRAGKHGCGWGARQGRSRWETRERDCAVGRPTLAAPQYREGRQLAARTSEGGGPAVIRRAVLYRWLFEPPALPLPHTYPRAAHTLPAIFKLVFRSLPSLGLPPPPPATDHPPHSPTPCVRGRWKRRNGTAASVRC